MRLEEYMKSRMQDDEDFSTYMLHLFPGWMAMTPGGLHPRPGNEWVQRTEALYDCCEQLGIRFDGRKAIDGQIIPLTEFCVHYAKGSHLRKLRDNWKSHLKLAGIDANTIQWRVPFHTELPLKTRWLQFNLEVEMHLAKMDTGFKQVKQYVNDSMKFRPY